MKAKTNLFNTDNTRFEVDAKTVPAQVTHIIVGTWVALAVTIGATNSLWLQPLPEAVYPLFPLSERPG